MKTACERWIELSDAEAIGEPLSEQDRQFQRAHAETCPECGQEAGIWGSLRATAYEPTPDDREVDAILGAARSTSTVVPIRFRTPAIAGAATVLACAAAAALWLGTRPPQAPVPNSSVIATQTAPQKVAAPGVPVPPGGNALAAGAEPSCSEVVSGVTVCLAADSKIASTSLSGADRSIELARGRAVVSLVPQPAGTTFSVTTSAGKVTAVGTIFSVAIGSDGGSIVRVSQGRVLVRESGAAKGRPVSASQMLRIGDTKPSPLAAVDRHEDLALLPASARTHEETAAVDSNAPVDSSAPRDASTAGPQHVSQEQTLAQARSLRARGEFREAAELYRKIYAQNPKSASGSAALVSLGELLLSSLNDPQGALSAFNSYLANGGPLAQEASFGKARALRALKRSAEERRTIEQFLASYPDSPQSRVLRRRLAELE
jgi:TolA-binding protein